MKRQFHKEAQIIKYPWWVNKKMEKEKGVSLIMMFVIMAVIVAIVLSVTVILVNEIKVIGNNSNATYALHLADSGIQKTSFYYKGGNNSICGLCSLCPVSGQEACNNCTVSGLSPNCQVSFNSTDSGGTYSVAANATASSTAIVSTGTYRGVKREASVTLLASSPSPSPSSTPTPTPSPSSFPTPTPTPSQSPTLTPTLSPSSTMLPPPSMFP